MLATEKEKLQVVEEKWQAAEDRCRQLEMTNKLLAETICLNEQNAVRENEIHAEEKRNMLATVQALLAEGAEDRKHHYEQIQQMQARLTEANVLRANAVTRNVIN